jgi:parvulin-like peptidyl-prolyl isomerase
MKKSGSLQDHLLTLLFFTILFGCTIFYGTPTALAEDNIIASGGGISITSQELEKTILQYKKASHTNVLTKAEEIGLLKNLIRRELILRLPEIDTFRNDPETQKAVKSYEDEFVVNKYLQKTIASKIHVSDEELREYYNQNRDKFADVPKVDASHILLRSHEEAEMVLKKLHEGVPFEELAKQYSTDLPMALEGGKMGTIAKGKTIPELEKELFLLAEGETSGIVDTKFGCHILRVDKIYPAAPKPFDQVSEEIKRTLIKEKEAKAFHEMTQKLEENTNVQIFEDKIDKLQMSENENPAKTSN